ncbi:hypothetical protein FGE12_16925 [Aggregicoccus sp. 17bor-14]|uniref:hypothetical protein n=1 Tax=Myxococcaceae TaxID=31 RepID=UPI00129C397E|nr:MULTISPECIES: hypothetical protein [Myxococcaceae]MBF5044085.1 hypothetical protein [Simulacricoccus sp. 17bor-14]MRI89836.1 hypothetical protein [Aggregicoccus sp. 17bor-14]
MAAALLLAAPAAPAAPPEPARAVAAEAPAPAASAPVSDPVSPPPPVATPPAPVHGPRVRVRLGGTSNWRSYCARPGVGRCADFDSRQDPALAGTSVDQAASVYLGFALEAEVLPFAEKLSWVNGLGASLEYAHAFNRLGINRTSGSASTPTESITAQDLTLALAALYRYPFTLWDRGLGLPGYVGVRAGAQSRSFALSGEEHLEFNTHRLFPAVGLETLVPLARRAQLEAGAQYFFSPGTGRGLGSAEQRTLETRSFGDSVSSSGWSARLGLSGEVWGPFGYVARVQLTRFRDHYSGAGTLAGWDEGGVAEETVTSAYWAVTLRY